MARVNFTAIVESITGKLAGSVFQDSYQGFQIRTRVSPRNPTSFYQQLRRGQFAFITRSFRNLTSTELASWQANAPPGESAINFYTSCNINLTLIGQSPISVFSPATMPASMNVVITELTGSSFKVQAQGGITTVPAGHKLLLQATAVRGSTQIFTNPSMYTPVISFEEGTDLSIITDILPKWISRYGVMKDEGRICLKTNLILKSNGLRGIDVVSCSNIEEMQKFTKVLSDTSSIFNSGTTANAIYPYTIPANSLATDGDCLTIVAAGVAQSGAVNWAIGMKLSGVVQELQVQTSPSQFYFMAKIVRLDASSYQLNMSADYSDVPADAQINIVDSIDWTIDNTIYFVIDSSIDSTLKASYIDINRENF